MQLESVVPGPPISNQQSNRIGRAILATHGTKNVTINVSSQDPPVHLARLGHIFWKADPDCVMTNRHWLRSKTGLHGILATSAEAASAVNTDVNSGLLDLAAIGQASAVYEVEGVLKMVTCALAPLTFEVRMGRVLGLLPGDYSVDGTVKAADYTVWRDRAQSGFELPNRNPKLTGSVGQGDYEFWIANSGTTIGGSLAGAKAPEPAAAYLAALSAPVAGSIGMEAALRDMR